ncbi:hypothetical protein D1AOALGA4SA_6390 [Olavius algarvensis Delta 1 endosymbiont]|nr:hypothetical protein D1AOALGA4SA_6390 [Olavius algarvensis Delta 1 endosymbiont]
MSILRALRNVLIGRAFSYAAKFSLSGSNSNRFEERSYNE